MSSVVRRTLTGVAIAAAVVGLIALDTIVPHGVILLGVTGIFALAGAGEAAEMVARRGRPARVALLLGVGTAFVLGAVHPEILPGFADSALMGLGMIAGCAALVTLVVSRGNAFAAVLAAWIAAPLVALCVWTEGYGHDALIALIAVSKAGDIAGYFIGRKFGRRHPFPTISPGKTVAGCVASLVAGVAVGALLAGLWTLGPEGLGYASGAIAGLCLNLAAQAGDLLESIVKRRAGVKDSGLLMGASGGVLDVLDSLLLTAPVAWVLLPRLAAWAD